MMNTRKAFAFKQRKYLPVFPKARGEATVYIEGYPYEDDEPMAATGFHGAQITIFFDQLSRYFAIDSHIHIGIDNFIYYKEGDITKVVSPDVYVVFGVNKNPQRRSFYTWAEGAVPTSVFEFLSDSTANKDRVEKVGLYLRDMGVQEYFIHQPELAKAAEFRGWRRSVSGGIVEMEPDAQGGLFSAALNLSFRWEVQPDSHVRLLRPYLPDGTPITTSSEEHQLRMEEHQLRVAAETQAREEAARRRAESARRREVEAELERLRQELERLKTRM